MTACFVLLLVMLLQSYDGQAFLVVDTMTRTSRPLTTSISSLHAINNMNLDAWERLTSRLQYALSITSTATTSAPSLLEEGNGNKNNDLFSWFHTTAQDAWTQNIASHSFPALPSTLFSSMTAPAVVFMVSVVSLLAVVFLYALSFPQSNYRQDKEPYPRGQYDPIAAQLYYPQQAPLVVVQRLLQLLRLSNGFVWNVLVWDKYIRKQNTNNPVIQQQRANELLSIVQRLGPTAIKIGQALSVRPDLIASEYAQALATLQDAVPPFPNARPVWEQSILQESGLPPNVKVDFDQPPMASASIGQVYQGYIAETGQTVAIKLQRPNVLAEIALDLYIVQNILLPLYSSIPANANNNLQPLIQEWGRGFIAELDYRQEAKNTMQFNVAMEARKLDNIIMAPNVVWSTLR